MHRQSLGSPAAKLHANGVITVAETSSSSPLSSSSEHQKKLPTINNHEDQQSPKKSHKTPPSRCPEKSIHLIPVLIIFCILVLYLSSHNPSQNELAQFNGFKPLSSNTIDYTNLDEIQRVSEIGKGDILAIRSARNLQGLHRKMGDF